MSLAYDTCAGECCRHTKHLGVCAHQHRCAHHTTTDADHRARQTHRDPTGNAAVNNIMREQKKRRG